MKKTIAGWTLFLALFVPLRSFATSHTWSGGGANTNWSTPANWSAGGAPAMNETNATLFFPASPVGYVAVNDVSGLSATSVTISDNGYAISGTGLTLSTNLTVDAPSPSSLSFDLPVAVPAGTLNIAVTASGTVLSMAGVVSGAGNISKSGAGKLSLGGTNTYLGTTTVTAGTLNMANASALGANATGTTVNAGAALTIQSQSAGLTVSEPLTLNGSGIGGTGALRAVDGSNTWSGPITLNTADATIGAITPGFLQLAGLMQGTGGLTTAGTGALSFSGTGANTYAGTTTVLSGSTLSANRIGVAVPGDLAVFGVFNALGSNQIAASSNVSVTTSPSSANFNLGNGYTQTIASLTLNGGHVWPQGATSILTLAGNVTTAGTLSSDIYSPGTLALGAATRTFTVAAGSGLSDDLVVGAVVTGSGVGIVKAGSGRMVMTGNNTFTGPTTVNAGTLIVNGMQQFSNVTVASGAVLGGSGTVRNLTANTGATVAPGSSPGILSAGPTVALNAGSTFAVEIYGTVAGTLYDQLTSSGTATLGATLAATVGYTPMVGDSFTIVQAATSVTGTFAGLADMATFCADGVTLQIHYAPTAVTLTVTSASDSSAPSVTAPAAATVTQTLCQ